MDLSNFLNLTEGEKEFFLKEIVASCTEEIYESNNRDNDVIQSTLLPLKIQAEALLSVIQNRRRNSKE
jgi:hypothetical protein